MIKPLSFLLALVYILGHGSSDICCLKIYLLFHFQSKVFLYYCLEPILTSNCSSTIPKHAAWLYPSSPPTVSALYPSLLPGYDCCFCVNLAKAPAEPEPGVSDSLLGLFLLPDLIPLHHLQPRWGDHKSPGMHSKKRTCDCSKAYHSFRDLESGHLGEYTLPLGPRWESTIPTSSETQRPSP